MARTELIGCTGTPKEASNGVPQPGAPSASPVAQHDGSSTHRQIFPIAAKTFPHPPPGVAFDGQLEGPPDKGRGPSALVLYPELTLGPYQYEPAISSLLESKFPFSDSAVARDPDSSSKASSSKASAACPGAFAVADATHTPLQRLRAPRRCARRSKRSVQASLPPRSR